MLEALVSKLGVTLLFNFGTEIFDKCSKKELVQHVLKEVGLKSTESDFSERYIETLVELRYNEKPQVLLEFFRAEDVMRVFYDFYYSKEKEHIRNSEFILNDRLIHYKKSLRVGEQLFSAEIDFVVEVQNFTTIFEQKIHENRSVHDTEVISKLVNIEKVISQKDTTGQINKLPKKLTLEVPRIPAENIVGRTKDLEELRQLIVDNREALLLNGMGGIGKTTLAQVYIHTFWEDYHHVIWVAQKPNSSFLIDFVNSNGLRTNLGIGDHINEPEDIFNEIIRRLNLIESKPNLIILDNVNSSIERLRNKLPDSPHWHLLLTSRYELEGFAIKQLDFLAPDDAFSLFKKYYLLSDLTKDQIKSLLKNVDYHTLTIEILAKTANQQRYDFEKISNALSNNAMANIKSVHPGGDKIERVTSFLSAVFMISDLNENETWLMQQFACLPSIYHTYVLLNLLIEPKSSKKEEVFSETLNELCHRGWLLKNEETDTYKMHIVVSEVIKQRQPPSFENVEQLFENISELLKINENTDNPIDKFLWIPFGKTLLVIVEKILCHSIEAENILANLRTNLAMILKDVGEYQEAKKLFQMALDSNKKNLGDKHILTIVAYSNLSLIYKILGDLAVAKELMEKAVIGHEKHLGFDHQSTSIRYSNYGVILQDLGEFRKAKFYLEKAVQFDEQKLGTNHPSTITSYTNLALVLKDLGELEKAKELLKKTLVLDEKNFSLNHPRIAVHHSNLGQIFLALGEFENALNELRKSVHSNENNFGKEHPATTNSYSNLAIALKESGQLEEAKKLLENSLITDEKRFGKDHSIIASRLSNLAAVLYDRQDYTTAKTLLYRALSIYEKNLGLVHHKTINLYSNLAAIHQQIKEFREAKKILEKVIEYSEKLYGSNHIQTAIYYSNYASILANLRCFTQAKELIMKSLKILRPQLPKGHPTLKIVEKSLENILRIVS